MTTSESKGRFFYKTNRFESIRITNRIESIRIANWNALPISCRSSAGQGKFAGQRPTFYHCTTPPTSSSSRNAILHELGLQSKLKIQ